MTSSDPHDTSEALMRLRADRIRHQMLDMRASRDAWRHRALHAETRMRELSADLERLRADLAICRASQKG